MEGIEGASFCFGTFYGAIAAGIVSQILIQIREARGKAGLKNRSFDKFPDSAQPNLTSSGIVRSSQQANIKAVMFSVLLVFFFGVAGVGVYYIVV
jgi:hypothetical protein